MNYWLIKTEPNTYTWDDLENDGFTYWDGVRNYLRVMKEGLYFHSVNQKSVVGIAEVIRESYQDPSCEDRNWVAVDDKPYKKLEKPLKQEIIKNDERLINMVLVRNSRLFVEPVMHEEFDVIVGLGQKR